MSDHADSTGGDAFTAEEQAAFDAYANGAEAPAAPVSSPEPAPAAPGAPEAPAAAPAAPADAAAPGDVVDPDAEDIDDVEKNKGKFVRHGALHKERMRRKEVERQLAEIQERFTRGDERFRLLTQAMQAAPQAQPPAQPAQPEPPKAPDPNEDIFGYAKHLEAQIAALQSGQQQMTEAQAQRAQAERAAQEEHAIVSAFQRDHARLVQADPAYGDAYGYLIQGRVAELKMFGLDDRQAIAQANADELSFVRACFERGVSPAEQAYALAKSRGFAPKAPAAPAAPPAETPAERQTRLALGQAASKSLSSAGGAPAGEVTLDMLASMSEPEFEAFAAKNPGKVARLMGEAA